MAKIVLFMVMLGFPAQILRAEVERDGCSSRGEEKALAEPQA
jgi:hypothetical protein